jgi:multidrug efflux pump subunit AcrA (membrane-fusion protein)
VDGYHIYFAVRVDEASTPLQGFSLRMTIPIESSAGEVLTVPVSAVSLAADGKSRVQVQDNEALRYVNVEPGLAANGFVEVRPLEGQLDPGQLVVVGSGPNEKIENASPQK